MVAVLAFILLFKLGDAAMGFMVKPFWVDAGFTAGQIGFVSVNLGLALSIAGGLVGGWYVQVSERWILSTTGWRHCRRKYSMSFRSLFTRPSRTL